MGSSNALPSDTATAGFFLGFSLAYVFTNLKMPQTFLIGLMQRYDVKNHIYVTFICLFSAEAYSLFPGFQGIYFSLKQLLGKYVW